MVDWASGPLTLHIRGSGYSGRPRVSPMKPLPLSWRLFIAFLMGEGFSPQHEDFALWRKFELALYHYLGTADTKRKQILADRLSDRRGSIPL